MISSRTGCSTPKQGSPILGSNITSSSWVARVLRTGSAVLVVGCHGELPQGHSDAGTVPKVGMEQTPPLCAVAFHVGSDARGRETLAAFASDEEPGLPRASISMPSDANSYAHLWWLTLIDPQRGSLTLSNLRHVGRYLTDEVRLEFLDTDAGAELSQWLLFRLPPVSRTDSSSDVRFRLVSASRPDWALALPVESDAPELQPIDDSLAQRLYLRSFAQCDL
jgi:hypothetical protein